MRTAARNSPAGSSDEPVHAGGDQVASPEVRVRPDDQLVFRRIERHDVERTPRRDAQPATLPHRVVRQTAVLAEPPPRGVDDRPRDESPRRGPARQESGVVVAGNEADLLTLRAFRRRETARARHRPHPILGEPAEGKSNPRERRARDREQEIRLILAAVRAPDEARLSIARPESNARIVTRGESIGPQFARLVEQQTEFHAGVAEGAGVRGAPGRVGRGEGRNDEALEFGAQIPAGERDAERREPLLPGPARAAAGG